MAIDFRSKTVTVPAGNNRQQIKGWVEFERPVRRANAALQGFKLDYLNEDHHVNIVEVDVDINGTAENRVDFTVECTYADKNFDDRYNGYVTVLILAETA